MNSAGLIAGEVCDRSGQVSNRVLPSQHLDHHGLIKQRPLRPDAELGPVAERQVAKCRSIRVEAERFL